MQLYSQLHGSSDVPNGFVHLSFDMVLKTVTCLFIHQQDTSTKHSCSIMYGLFGKTCNTLGYQSSLNTSNHVQIGLPIDYLLHQSPKEYCFRVTASNKTFTVLVEGSLNFNFTTGPGKCKHNICLFIHYPKVFVYIHRRC